MKLTISKDANLNYLAKVLKIDSFHSHPNADRLKLANINGYNISVGIDTKPGIFVYFPLESQISSDILRKNNLYRKVELNKDSEAKPGFFEEKGRVRAINLRGFVSEGFLLPIESIIDEIPQSFDDYIDKEFDTINGELIIKKYIVQQPKGSGPKNTTNKSWKYSDKIVENQFRFHKDTLQLKNNLHLIKPETIIQISSKWHGTSQISVNLLVTKELSFFEKLLKKIGFKIQDTEYKDFCSSRKVIKDPEINNRLKEGYYNYDIHNLAHQILKPYLCKGMSMYTELVGYLPTGRHIQKDYDYGCIYDPVTYNYEKMTPKEMYDAKLFKIIVYRITYTSVDGKVFEMNSRNLQEYCISNGLVPVVEYFYGSVDEYLNRKNKVYRNSEEVDPDDISSIFLDTVTKDYLEKISVHCNNEVPDEGIVIRIDKPEFSAFKLKSRKFFLHETKMLDQGEIDMEENEN